MRNPGLTARFLPLLLPSILAGGILWFGVQPSRAEDDSSNREAGSLQPPVWQIGESWVVETLTQRVQGRETETAGESPKVRWKFQVTSVDKVAGSECYRIEVQCLARGRIRPEATVWCDRNTLFLRQFQTQLAFNGRYRQVQESYACPKGATSPVIPFVNVLPLAMPAFLPAGAKGGESFSYTSQPLPSGSKDTGIIRFVHAMKQESQPAGAKAMEKAHTAYSKNLDAKPVVEVTLADNQRSVMQLWQKGEPWPIYVEDGRTQAWLVSTKRP